jgi:hypothetical protein
MKISDFIKLPFLNRQAQVIRDEPQTIAGTPATASPAQEIKVMNAMSAIDKAIDVLERPEPPPILPMRIGDIKSMSRLDTIQAEAEATRQAIREDTRKLFEKNKLDAEKARREKAEQADRKLKALTENKDAWEALMRPHVKGEVSVRVTKQLIVRLIEFGKLRDVRNKCAAKVSKLLDDWDIAFEARSKATRAAFKRQLLDDIADNAQRLRDGCSDLRPLQSEEQLEHNFSILRSQCRERQLEVSKQINPVLLELAEHLQAAARRLANEMFVREKSDAELFSIMFEPSCCLKFLICAGLNLRKEIESSHLASQASCPRSTLYGILDSNTTF